jgi:hypothetical protein
MCRSPLLLLLVTLASTSAAAQSEDAGYEEEEQPQTELDGTSRLSVQTGWRYTPNTRFYDNYYSDVDNRGLQRSRGAIGGPLLTGTFAYSITNLVELGIDLFATYERMQLTGQPGLNAVTYGALLGLRFQHRFDIGPHGLVPSVGLLLGPLLAAAYFDGGFAVENYTQAIGATVGATLGLTPKWGLRVEYRLLAAKGTAEDVGLYEAGGNWFSVGFNYTFPSEPDRPMGRNF